MVSSLQPGGGTRERGYNSPHVADSRLKRLDLRCSDTAAQRYAVSHFSTELDCREGTARVAGERKKVGGERAGLPWQIAQL
jgi:hypothetical protein